MFELECRRRKKRVVVVSGERRWVEEAEYLQVVIYVCKQKTTYEVWYGLVGAEV